jgi:hypothetical protein
MMTAAALLADLTADGLSLTIGDDNTLILRGDRASRAKYLPTVRDHKPALLALLAAPANDDEGAVSNKCVADYHPSPVAASCGICAHFQRDPINPPGGMGRCLINAPESRRPGTLWPTGAVECTSFATQAGEEGYE